MRSTPRVVPDVAFDEGESSSRARRRIRVASLALLGMGALAACTSGGSDHTTQAARTCGYADATMVSAAYGGTVTASTASTSGTGSQLCSFTMTTTNLGFPGVVSLTRVTSGADGFAQVKAAHPEATPVSGLGDDAFYLPASSQLQFLKGGNVVIIDTMAGVPAGPQPDPAATQADAMALGTAIAAGL